jgi:mRNA-degrading endonuclease YafQ of YafQ-DinJ toxin-antitoxin module
MKVSFDPAFKRVFARRIATSEKLRRKFDELLPIFITDPFDHRLRTHKLSGKLEGLLSFCVDYDIRAVFYFEGKDKAVFLDIDTPDEVY